MDGFIDDIITITFNETNWIERAKSAALLVIRTLSQSLQASKPIKRNDPLSQRKLAGDGETGRTKNLSRMGHKHTFLESIYTKIEAEILGQRHQGHIIFNKN